MRSMCLLYLGFEICQLYPETTSRNKHLLGVSRLLDTTRREASYHKAHTGHFHILILSRIDNLHAHINAPPPHETVHNADDSLRLGRTKIVLNSRLGLDAKVSRLIVLTIEVGSKVHFGT